MSELRCDGFATFFKALYGMDPFPWQQRLATEVCTKGRFPPLIDLPTGTGKTACVDIALYHLAYDLSRADSRFAPLRIAWVVDRRLVVDDVRDRAKMIANKLESARTGILAEVASAFSRLAGPEERPLHVVRLRGGIPRERDWVKTPVQPTVISSTVDQIGSRVLFRGYGVRDVMRPLHAGLLGEDTLIVLDEVHLSEPFRQTLEFLDDYRKAHPQTPWQFVQLSATPRARAAGPAPFRLDDKDRLNPTLRARLQASKPVLLEHLGRVQAGSEAHADRFAEVAMRLAPPAGPLRNVLVIVNRVELARRVHQKLEARLLCAGVSAEVTRLVGRGRDIEKDKIRDLVVERCASNRGVASAGDGRQFFVVATQTVEAGADLDFDALVSQIAPIDALRQRFGRLNRMGRPIDASGAILAVDGEVAVSAKEDPVYGFSARETWQWLEDAVKSIEGNHVDFATDKLIVPVERLPLMVSPSLDAPILMPDHVAMFSQTSPVPAASPDPSVYLHGSPKSPADVNIVWRADLEDNTRSSRDLVETITRLLALVPPRAGEVLAMPVGTVQRWLRGEQTQSTSDLEIDLSSEPEGDATAGIRAWRWRGADEDVEEVLRGRVRPGDTIVVASDAGGCDEFGWNPQCTHVRDIADLAARPYEARSFAVRVHPRLLAQVDGADRLSSGLNADKSLPNKLIGIVEASGNRVNEVLAALIDREAKIGLPQTLLDDLKKLRSARGRVTIEFPYGTTDEDRVGAGFILAAKRGLDIAHATDAEEASTEGDGIASVGTGPLTLLQHSNDVKGYLDDWTRRLRLPSSIAEDVVLAGYLHDLGKADPRFQRYLSGRFRRAETILAKSGVRRSSREDAIAKRDAGLGNRWRHEALSVRVAPKHPAFLGAHDPELVLWLVGTHHGYGRPRFPHDEARDMETVVFRGFAPDPEMDLTLDASPGPQRLDFALTVPGPEGLMVIDWSGMFRRLKERYGSWGLAYFEAMVRLADHRASEKPFQTVGLAHEA